MDKEYRFTLLTKDGNKHIADVVGRNEDEARDIVERNYMYNEILNVEELED